MSSYKLTYFNLRGRAEVARLLFALADVDFVDERITDWTSLKPKTITGSLPYLTIDNDIKLVQSLAICRYIARKYNLAGSDALTQAQADAIIDFVGELQTDFINKVLRASNEEKQEASRNFFKDVAPPILEKIEKLIQLYGKNGFSAGDKITWADLYVFEVTDVLLDRETTLLDRFDSIKRVRKSVESNEKIKEYIKKRQKTPF